MQITTIGLDLAKSIFQVHGIRRQASQAYQARQKTAWHALARRRFQTQARPG